MKWILLGIPGIVFCTWMAMAWQTKKVDDTALKNAPKGTEWLSHGMGWSEQRYSTLKQITPDNINKLSLAWSYELGPGGDAQKANPLYSNGVLYTVTTWSVVAAVDARTGKELWRYEPEIDAAMKANSGSRLCCGINTRGLAMYDGKIFVAVVDGNLQALDAKTGKRLWSSWAIPEPKPGDPVSSYSLTMAPRAANGKVFIGNAGAEFPPYRGYISAFDTNTGKELWKFYATPGDPSKPFENKAMEAAAKTWAGKWWEQGGGGSMWDGMAYDPDENLVYIGTGNGATWSSDIRNGGAKEHLDNLYVASILAINASTGQLKWHYQCTPGDEWDYDAIQALLLADIRINNRNRKVILQANKNGYFYVIDRVSGEFISASEMSEVSWTTSIDPKTGRANIHPDALYSSTKGTTVAPLQMHNTSQMSFNPNTGLVYVPINITGSYSFQAAETYAPTPGRQNFGLNTRGQAPRGAPPIHGPVRENPDGTAPRGGILSAWDPATQTEKWFSIGGGQTGGGTLSLATNLVIQTLNNGRMRAFTADTGKQLLDMALPLNSGVGAPITYELDGKQYIAVLAGTGARGGGGAGGGAPRGGAGAPGGRGAAGGPGAPPAAPGTPQEPTAAAAAAQAAAPQRGNAPAGAPQAPAPQGGAAPALPGAPATNNNPKLFVYTVDPAAAAK